MTFCCTKVIFLLFWLAASPSRIQTRTFLQLRPDWGSYSSRCTWLDAPPVSWRQPKQHFRPNIVNLGMHAKPKDHGDIWRYLDLGSNPSKAKKRNEIAFIFKY